MTVSVRMDPLLESELAIAARRQGVTKSQFIISAVERALGRRSQYEVLLAVEAEQAAPEAASGSAPEPAYRTGAAKAALTRKLRAKHGVGGTD